MVRTQIQLTESQVQHLKQLAAEQNTSMAEIIRRSIDEYLHKNHGVDERQRIARAKAIAGRFHSGQGDISIKHDEYLGEIFK